MMSQTSPDRRRVDVLYLWLAALLVRLIAFALAHATGHAPEFWEYEVIARNLLAGKGFLYHHMGLDHWAYVEPLYPFFVAAVYLVTGYSTWALGVVQCALAALLGPLTYRFALATFDRGAALAAGTLVVLDPALVGYATKFHALTFDALAIALVALTFLRLVDAPTSSRAIVFGLAAGACVLTRPTVLTFVAVALVWATWRGRRTLVCTLLGIAVASVVVGPWVARNYAITGAFVLTRSHVGFGFWLGNHAGATGGEGLASDASGTRSIFAQASPALREEALSQPDEIAQDRVFRAAALRYVAEDPAGFLVRTARKLGYFWWFAPYTGKRYERTAVRIYQGFYVVALTLALLGLWVVWRTPLPAQTTGVTVALVVLAAISLGQAAFYVQGRHRLGVEALLIVFSGRGASWLWSRSMIARTSQRGATMSRDVDA